jgi:hypothetical protein
MLDKIKYPRKQLRFDLTIAIGRASDALTQRPSCVAIGSAADALTQRTSCIAADNSADNLAGQLIKIIYNIAIYIFNSIKF